MARRTIWVDDWQMQCCGEPITVGRTATWTVSTPTPGAASPLAGLTPPVTAHEDHHDCATGPMVRLTGRITAIHAAFAHHRFDPPGSRTLVAVPGTLALEPRDAADGWEPEAEWDQAGPRFIGYVVDVTDTVTEPIEQARPSRIRRLINRLGR